MERHQHAMLVLPGDIKRFKAVYHALNVRKTHSVLTLGLGNVGSAGTHMFLMASLEHHRASVDLDTMQYTIRKPWKLFLKTWYQAVNGSASSVLKARHACIPTPRVVRLVQQKAFGERHQIP